MPSLRTCASCKCRHRCGVCIQPGQQQRAVKVFLTQLQRRKCTSAVKKASDATGRQHYLATKQGQRFASSGTGAGCRLG